MKSWWVSLQDVHRLDRLTSGIVVIAKTNSMCEKLTSNLKDTEAHKVYLARVGGKVTEAKFTVNKKIKCLSKKLSKYDTCDDSDPDGKESITDFELVNYNEKNDTSLLKCSIIRLSENRQNPSNSSSSEVSGLSDPKWHQLRRPFSR